MSIEEPADLTKIEPSSEPEAETEESVVMFEGQLNKFLKRKGEMATIGMSDIFERVGVLAAKGKTEYVQEVLKFAKKNKINLDKSIQESLSDTAWYLGEGTDSGEAVQMFLMFMAVVALKDHLKPDTIEKIKKMLPAFAATDPQILKREGEWLSNEFGIDIETFLKKEAPALDQIDVSDDVLPNKNKLLPHNEK